MAAYIIHMQSLLGTFDSLPVVSVLAGIIGLLGLGYFGYVLYQLRLSPLSKIPGPCLASLSSLWRTRRVLIGNWHEDIVGLHAKYGDLVRISPDEIAINTPDAVHKIYGHTGKPWVKSRWYEVWWQPGMTHAFFSETSPAAHRDLRRRVTKAYSMTNILGMEDYINPLVARFRSNMEKAAGDIVDMSMHTQYFAFDAVGELAFGKAFGFLEKEKDFNGLLGIVYNYMTTAAAFAFFPQMGLAGRSAWVRYILNKSFLKRVNKRLDEDPVKPFERLVREKVSLSQDHDRHDLLSHFQSATNVDESPMSPMDIFGESMNVVGAGADTTAISVRAILRYVCTNPRVYIKLQAELDAATANGKLSDVPTFAEGSSLPYFQAVIKEALRVFPAVGYQLPRIVPEGGAEISGAFLPGGTVVSINGWALHRNKSVFGEDADEFRPERWLEEDTAKLATMNQCYASFGFGSRTCIGKNMAMMEINKLVPMIFRDFDVQVSNAEYPWDVITSWFAYQSKFYCRLTRRKGPDHAV